MPRRNAETGTSEEIAQSVGKAGMKLARDVVRLATGKATLEDVGPDVFIASDGTVGVYVDGDTFAELRPPKR